MGKYLASAALVLAVAAVASAPVLAQDGQCLTRREIQDRIASGEVRPLADAMAAAQVAGKIISSGAELCRVGGRWEWRVNVMDDSGESRPVSLPAQ
jgi:hypothetical protein